MRSRSRLIVITYFASLLLLGILFGFFHQFIVKARNVPLTLVDGEATETDTPCDIENGENPPVHIHSVEDVRWVFHVIDYDKRMERARQYLIRVGERAFPTYEAILSDPKATSQEVCGIFCVLDDVKADRRRFRMSTISRFMDIDYGVRLNAVILLQQIGSSADASPVVALLSDERREVAYAAAKTLMAIGGQNEVVAIDVWLRGVSHRDDRQLREHVQKCRDELKKRLDAKKSSKK